MGQRNGVGGMGPNFGVGGVGPRCFVKKVPLKSSQDLQENICGGISCYIKLQDEDFQVY